MIKNILKKSSFISYLFYNYKKIDEISCVNRTNQILLSLKYKELLNNGIKLPDFQDVEFRSFSQNGEDGILLFLFSLIGTTNKIVVEMCSGHGIESNSANLIINHGWRGLLFDGDKNQIKFGNNFFKKNRNTIIYPPQLLTKWIDKENINNLITENDISGEIDLFSLDMDGNDYWILKNLTCIQPRIILLEFNNAIPEDKSITIPYKKDFSRFDLDDEYYSASLSAFTKLVKEKGYRLIGVQQYGFNAFFIRNGIGESLFPEKTVSDCLNNYYTKTKILKHWERISKYDWVNV